VDHVRLTTDVRDDLIQHAVDVAPLEACGVVGFSNGESTRYIRGRNLAKEPDKFELEIEPWVWFLEEEGWQLALFHSHVKGPPRPSESDTRGAKLLGNRPILILSLDRGILTAWELNGKEPVELPVEILGV
jgi:proteasome lid subunit RPN8/RPN11